MSKILVADDDAAIRQLCVTVLGGEGFEVVEAADGASCVKLAREHRPDVVLLDWVMPGVDGMDTLRAIKRANPTREIPVIMLTALDSTAHIHVATREGADGYVTKPFDVNDLLALVRRFASSR